MTTVEEVGEILVMLAAQIPSAPKMGKTNRDAYHIILEDVPIDVLRAAALEYAKDSTFMPSAGQLRSSAFELMERAQGIPSPQDAWGEVTKSFGPYGIYTGAPEWSHPIIGQAVDGLGGYAALCRSENPTADRARFIESYKSYLGRHRDETSSLPEVRNVIKQLADKMNVNKLLKEK